MSERTEEARLMVEAVSLLLERAREIEVTTTDGFRRGQQRAAEIDLRWAAIEERLERIERRLAWLVPRLKPGPGQAAEFARLVAEIDSLPVHARRSADVVA
jgi:hypothetical protein